MNTNKQINIMILLLFFSVLVTAGYTLWDSGRANEAEDDQAHATIRRGAYLFSQNCRACHGDAGEGGAASDRLRAAPALNRADLQGEVDGEITDVSFANAYKLVYDTISCGRVGKVMPAWAQIQGGTLNDEQIKQLTEFITRGGDEGWAIAAEFGRFNDHELHLETADDRNELRLAEAIGEGDTVLRLDSLLAAPPGSRVEGFVVVTENPDGTVDRVPRINPGDRLAILEEVEASADGESEVVIPETIEIMLVVEDGVDVEANTVTVERGFGRTAAQAHAAGTHVIQPPPPPAEPQVVERACGQFAQAQSTLPPEPPSTELSIVAQGIAWNKTQLSAIQDQPLTLTVDNRDDGVLHNWHLTEGADPGGDEVATTELEEGPVTQTLNFGPLAAGEYYYVCDVHPQMEGVLTAGPATGGPAADATETPVADTTPSP